MCLCVLYLYMFVHLGGCFIMWYIYATYVCVGGWWAELGPMMLCPPDVKPVGAQFQSVKFEVWLRNHG